VEGPLLLNKRANDKIRDIVLTKAKQVLGDKFHEAKRVIEATDVTKAVIDREHDIPYLAGSSKDGKVVYIDRHLPKELKVGGQLIDPAKYLAVHELCERSIMVNMGAEYPSAHQIAEAWEKAVVQADGLNWQDYEKALDGFISQAEHEKIEKAPADLYTKPYDKVLKNRIKRHQELNGSST
jgi:hypothetical protein